jgi:hypothetical protein
MSYNFHICKQKLQYDTLLINDMFICRVFATVGRIMCLDFAHRLMFVTNSVFRKVDLFPSSGKMMGAPLLGPCLSR